ncbi:Beta-1 3-galactosyl-O-glycosyl-glycoprotein beta-1 6-N-acetylglucosaminyltransferase [Fasciola gigantica]|uniref:Beta-1 3-galactosyl-O-glycosyl-glycoprotein beta-1 6-N-acetylglucosaminyltransferase n=1 Tax=Fasciola gigantica TaxID=46835 RepID=A0A504YRE6_FASGI|nr:Beta-1 3-galactosyl-O-glycosyl-glycoprotein beta-1 6-N-acetylglucosaminyltransferase [Fasciola gigantica]
MKGTGSKLKGTLNFFISNMKFFLLFICITFLLTNYLQKMERLVSWERTDPQNPTESYFTQCPLIIANSTVSHSYTVQPEEIEFPLAFSLVVYTDSDRVLRLIRAIYRPHNYYCIHIDRKSAPTFVEEIERLQQCTELSHNVYFVELSDRVDVRWGRISVLDADLICARILLDRAPNRWKYWINLTGQEFPLRTNWELVRALRLLNGSNVVDAIYRRRIMHRCPPRGAFPFNVTYYKGSVHIAVRHEFVDYALNSPRGQMLYETLAKHERSTKKLIMPEETFFATLNHNPTVFPIPGAFTGVHEQHVAIPLARAKIWTDSRKSCGSRRWRRSICMFGLADLPFLFSQPHFFANKFLPTVEPLAYDILEWWYFTKVRNESMYHRLANSFNSSYYRLSPYSAQHL